MLGFEVISISQVDHLIEDKFDLTCAVLLRCSIIYHAEGLYNEAPHFTLATCLALQLQWVTVSFVLQQQTARLQTARSSSSHGYNLFARKQRATAKRHRPKGSIPRSTEIPSHQCQRHTCPTLRSHPRHLAQQPAQQKCHLNPIA